MIVRNATIADVEQIIDIRIATWKTTYKKLLSEGVFNDLDKNRAAKIKEIEENFYDKETEGRKEYRAVAEFKNKIVGFSIYGKCRDEESLGLKNAGEIYAVYVLKEYQNMGTGRLLVNYSARVLFNEEKYTSIVIWALEGNQYRKFYTSIGGVEKFRKQIKIGDRDLEEVGYYFDDIEKLKFDVLSIREHPENAREAIGYFQEKWANKDTMMVYEDCIIHCIGAENPLPQWYLLKDGDKIVGCAGLITNDFISRMDLYPWICALFVEKKYRGKKLGFKLLEKAKSDARSYGFRYAYLCTDHVGYYEKNGFEYIGIGYHPCGSSSRIYRVNL